MVIWISRKRRLRKRCVDGTTRSTTPADTAARADDVQPEESLPRGVLLILAKVFLFFLVAAGLALLMGYAALTTSLLARH